MSKYEELDLKILHMLSVKPTPVFDIWLKFRDDVRDITVTEKERFCAQRSRMWLG